MPARSNTQCIQVGHCDRGKDNCSVPNKTGSIDGQTGHEATSKIPASNSGLTSLSVGLVLQTSKPNHFIGLTRIVGANALAVITIENLFAPIAFEDSDIWSQRKV
jgi:hypothetical protein